MRSVLFLLLLVCVLVPVIPIGCLAQDFQPIPAQDFQVREVPGNPNAPVIVLEHRDEIEGGKHTVYSRIKVLTSAGLEYANVRLEFDKKKVKGVDVLARTVHADGSIVPFTGKPFDSVLAKSRSRRYDAKVFALPDVQVGSIIEYRYTVRCDCDFWIPSQWNVQTDDHQKRVYFRVKQPFVSQLGWTANLPAGAAPNREKETLTLEMTDVPAFAKEEGMPAPDLYRHKVRFHFGGGQALNYWASTGSSNWKRDIEDFCGKNKGELQGKVSELTSATDTPEQKVRKIYAYVGKMENLSYENRSEQELKRMGITSHQEIQRRQLYFNELVTVGVSPKMLMKVNAGERDSITRLFVALVRAAGIKAWVMRVTARDDSYFVPEHRNFDQLDTELAIVELDGIDVFLDPGTPYAPYGMLDWALTGAQGIRQLGNNAVGLLTTADPSYKDATIKRLSVLKMDAEGLLSGKVTVAYFGQAALQMRLSLMSKDAQGQKDYLAGLLKAGLPKQSRVSLLNMPEWNTSADPLVAIFDVSLPAVSQVGRRSLLSAHIFQFDRPQQFVAEKRTYPVYMEYPYAVQDEIRIAVPEGMSIESFPAKEILNPPFGTYRAEYRQKDGEIIASRVLVMNQYVFPPRDYPELRGFFAKVKNADDQQIVLTKANTASSGK